tara:strand:- start:185 stop:574 length:390 start_codon:yes stop_codon:yes gene_type:complete
MENWWTQVTTTVFLFGLLVKHAIADLGLQSRLNNPKYGDKKNLTDTKLWIHSLDHAGLTALVCLLFVGLIPALLIGLLDFVLHAIIDYIKRVYTLKKKIGMQSPRFWQIQAIDQIAHYTCYFAYVIIII